MPIYRRRRFNCASTEHAANLFGLSELGNIYTRITNPTNDVLEQRVAAIEGGAAALAVASGQAASAFAIQNITHAGDNFVASTDLYGGTWNLFANTMKDMGIECRLLTRVIQRSPKRRTSEPVVIMLKHTQPEASGIPYQRGSGDRTYLRRSIDHG